MYEYSQSGRIDEKYFFAVVITEESFNDYI